ncbi:hypothetical protein COV82_04100 [Candidatus Peregrinibacteria bacterium CG11_big_fil_rev_8_21_14_0_20_46_8]|nr:MAG: hypothetical protein COV82_04100 [Candidatus Peregrinibacteria bacterium CG11_big_fil_rev_8_21_14_0_20_46_8]
MQKSPSKRYAGTLLEIIIALGIFAFAAAGLVVLSLGALTGTQRAEDRLRANAFGQQAMEAARAIRDYEWTNLPAGTHGLTDSNGYWELSGNSDLLDNYFTRTITVTDIDANTKNISVRVSWVPYPGATDQIEFTGRLRDIVSERWTQTVEADFSPGTADKIAVVDTNGGALELIRMGNWTEASILTTYDFGGDADVNGLTVVDDRLFTVAKNNGADEEFTVFDLTQLGQANLPELGSVELSTVCNDVSVQGNYAYVSTEDGNEEIKIIDLTTYQKVNGINLPGSNKTYGMQIENNMLYIGAERSGSGEEFFAYDISDPLGAMTTPAGSTEIGERVSSVDIQGNYAYLATSHDSRELAIVRLSDFLLVKSIDVEDDENMRSVIADGNSLYMGREGDTDNDIKSLYIFDISTPEGTVPLQNSIKLQNGLDEDITDMVQIDNRIFASVDNGSQEIAVILLNPLSIESRFDLNQSTVSDTIALYENYILAGTRHNSETLQVLQGGEGGAQTYRTNGTFISTAHNSGSSSTTYGNLTWTASGTGSVSFQIRTASSEAELANATWVGPDGTSGTSFTSSGTAITTAPGAGTQWIQYQVTLSGDGTQTPIIEDVSISY